MKLSYLMKILWPTKAPEPELSPSEINRLVGERAGEYAEERLQAYDAQVRIANARAAKAENIAKEQIASLQKIYIEMLTDCHVEIAELKRQLTIRKDTYKSVS